MAGEGKAIKKGKKNRKHKRSLRAPANAQYKAEQRWIKNKFLKVVKHLRKHPDDSQTKDFLKHYCSSYPAHALRLKILKND